jgi:uncharacterized protein (TIGR02646 family)
VKIQNVKPARSVVPARQPYTAYRVELRADFNGCCGYCDDSDRGNDQIGFHIDHFAPKGRFKELICEYTNLVYACRFCNIHKSSKWTGVDASAHHDGSEGFIDPCSEDYDAHLARDEEGRIVGKTELGRYIARELNLGLLRHQLLWKARRARTVRDEIPPLIDQYKASGLPRDDLYADLLERFIELQQKIDRYELAAAHG